MSRLRPARPKREHRPPPQGRCSTSGKRSWSRRADARQHLRDLRANGDRRADELVTYRCAECEAWHVGHRRRAA